MKNVALKSMLLALVAIVGSSVFFSANAQSKTAAPKVSEHLTSRIEKDDKK